MISSMDIRRGTVLISAALSARNCILGCCTQTSSGAGMTSGLPRSATEREELRAALQNQRRRYTSTTDTHNLDVAGDDTIADVLGLPEFRYELLSGFRC